MLDIATNLRLASHLVEVDPISEFIVIFDFRINIQDLLEQAESRSYGGDRADSSWVLLQIQTTQQPVIVRG